MIAVAVQQPGQALVAVRVLLCVMCYLLTKTIAKHKLVAVSTLW
jgi:hypothetical protein